MAAIMHEAIGRLAGRRGCGQASTNAAKRRNAQESRARPIRRALAGRRPADRLTGRMTHNLVIGNLELTEGFITGNLELPH